MMDMIKSNTSTGTNIIEKWQSSKKTIKARFSFLFNNEKLSDIHFILGKNKQHRIPAHKLILAAASDVFETFFFGPIATESDQIELPDIEPTIFIAFLKFIYTDETKIDHETVMSTLYVAKKYNVTVLEEYCVKFLEANLDCDHAVLLLNQARFFDEPELANKCLDSIDRNAEEALASDEFIDINLDTLTELLKRDTLQIEELKLYEAILRWTKAECARKQLAVTSENQRLVLGPAFKLIRFPLMSIEEFAIGPVQSGLLSDREVKELMLNITVNPKPAVEFSDVPREKLIRKEQIVKRFNNNYPGWTRLGDTYYDGIDLMVDRPIFIVGFGLYGSYDRSILIDVHIQLKHKDSNTVCGSTKTFIHLDGSEKICKVRFQKPIKITPKTYYRASVRMKFRTDAIYNWFGTGAQSKVTINDLNGKPINFQFAPTELKGGQIPQIIFYL